MTTNRQQPEMPSEKQCPQCGAPVSTQQRGRPRVYCSHSCRQSAYEERRGIDPWTERYQPGNDPFKVLENNASRHAMRVSNKRLAGAARQVDRDPEALYTSERAAREICSTFPTLCIEVVISDVLYCSAVLDHLSELILTQQFPSDQARWDLCVQSILRLRSDVDLVTGAIPSDPVLTSTPVVHNRKLSTEPLRSGDWPAAFRKDSRRGRRS